VWGVAFTACLVFFLFFSFQFPFAIQETVDLFKQMTSLALSLHRFWRFAVDEMAQADLPATLIYIRKVTNATKVGHD
jgi:hypothetical protein